MKRTRINFAIKTTKGKRAINQDSLVCTFNYNSNFIAIVCDGIGSIKHSEVASKLMCQIFATEFEKTKKIDKPIIWAKKTLELAINKLKYLALSNNTPDISTTMAMLIVIENQYYVFNIGDTRIYGVTNKEVKQLTKDHNYYNYLVKKGASEKVIKDNQNKWFALTRYIDGSKINKAKFDYSSGQTSDFKYFLICTDGLYGYVEKNEISKISNIKILPLVWRSSILNRKALKAGSNDNISNILVSCTTHGK